MEFTSHSTAAVQRVTTVRSNNERAINSYGFNTFYCFNFNQSGLSIELNCVLY
jgi:uncharacterized protein (DUF1015 family)